jgi:hypothetical protein
MYLVDFWKILADAGPSEASGKRENTTANHRYWQDRSFTYLGIVSGSREAEEELWWYGDEFHDLWVCEACILYVESSPRATTTTFANRRGGYAAAIEIYEILPGQLSVKRL